MQITGGPCDHEIVRIIDLRPEPPSSTQGVHRPQTSEVPIIRKGCVAETQERDHAMRCEQAEGEPQEAHGILLRRWFRSTGPVQEAEERFAG